MYRQYSGTQTLTTELKFANALKTAELYATDWDCMCGHFYMKHSYSRCHQHVHDTLAMDHSYVGVSTDNEVTIHHVSK